MSLREGHAVTTDKIGIMPAGKVAYGDELFTADILTTLQNIGDIWLHVSLMDNVIVDGWMAVKHLGVALMTLGILSTEPPPTDDPYISAILTTASGKTEKWIPEN